MRQKNQEAEAGQEKEYGIYKSTDYRKPKVLELPYGARTRYGFIGRSPKRWWARAGARGGRVGAT